MKLSKSGLAKSFLDSVRDLLPILIVIAFFQLVVLQQPIPNFGKLVYGTLLVVIGLTLFVRGLETGLFPIGESMAFAFARKGIGFETMDTAAAARTFNVLANESRKVAAVLYL